MKRNLLFNLLEKAYSKTFILNIMMLVLFALVPTKKVFAQCTGYNYMAYESFKTFNTTGASVTAPVAIAPLSSVGVGSWAGFGVSSNVNGGYSGYTYARYTSTTGYLITPQLSSTGTVTVTFYSRSLTAAASSLGFEYSTDYAGGDPATATWTSIGTHSNTTTAYTTTALSTFVPGGNFYLRVKRTNASGAVPVLDDLGISSSVASENIQIVLPRLTSTTPVSCTTVAFAIGQEKMFYDNGGVSDNHGATNSAPVVNPQDHTVTFMPAAGEQIELTILAYDVNATPTGSISISNTDNTITNYTGTYAGLSFTVYNSTAGDGSATVRYVTTGHTGAGFEIKVKSKPPVATCPNLTSASASNMTASSVQLNWPAPGTAPSGGFDYYISTSSTTPTGATVPTGNQSTTTATSVVASGLSGSTVYYAWVRTNCGGTNGNWIAITSTTFTTLCAPYSVPYLEDFNGTSVLPVCTSTSGSWGVNNTLGNLFGNTIGGNFYTKPFSLTAGTTYRLSYDFYAGPTQTTITEFFVAYGMTNGAPSTASYTDLDYHYSVQTFSSNMVNFTPSVTGTYYFRFYIDYLDPSTTLNLDNIRIEIESCYPPIALANNTVTSSSANITWTAPSSPPSAYQYLLTTSPAPPVYGDTPTGSVGTTGVSLAGLLGNTTYYVWVRSNCGGAYSAWSATSTSFTTLAAPSFVNINMSNGTSTGCNFNFFDSAGSGSNYSNFEVFTRTFYPSTAGSKLRVDFSTFDTENRYDGLVIYNGNSTAAPIIPSGLPVGTDPVTCPANSFYGTNSPGTIYSTAADGSLTFVFRSDYLITRAGWSATITCVTLPIISSFTPANNSCTTGTVVTITGNNFTAVPVTSVKFNGISASYTVNSNTQITATLPAGATTGYITVSNAQATGTSITKFVVLDPPIVTTGATTCVGGTGTLTSSAICQTYTSSISGSWSASDPTTVRPNTTTNSGVCGFSTYIRNYTAVQFQINITGSYTFEMDNNAAYDAMGYITTGAFTPGSCATGTFIVGDDDSGAAGNEPMMTAVLTAGVTYTLYSTTWATSNGTVTGSYNWTVFSPTGGQIVTNAGVLEWYDAPTGGTLLGTGSPFNPVGTALLPNTNTPGTTTFYGACSNNPTCRTATTFVINSIGTASSDQSICTGSPADLTVSIPSGSVVKWQWSTTSTFTVANDIPSSASTTLTSAQMGVLTATRYYRAVVNTGSCVGNTNVVTITYNKTTFNGTWSNGTPTNTVAAEFQGNYTSSGNLNACSVQVSAGNVVFASGHTLTVQNEVKVTGGTLTFNNASSLLQVNSSIPNTGNITYKRNTTPLLKFDYTYWSTPVSPQTLSDVSPTTPLFFEYNSTTENWVQDLPSTTMTPGKGYIIRAPVAYSEVGPAAIYSANLVGVPNNGTYTVPVVGGTDQLNLLGNPYPSAISAASFVSDAANTPFIDATIYLWTHNTPIDVAYQYAGQDYAVWNILGGAGTYPSPNPGLNSNIPNGYIAAGQGFFIKGLSSGVATFKNSMRVSGNNTQFFRMNTDTTSDLERHRIWLDISNEDNAYKQILIGYITGGTDGLDRGFDSEMVDVGGNVTMYTKVDNTKLSILGRGLTFADTDTFALGYKSLINSTYTIQLSDFDGLFVNQNIYLEDTELNIIHDLKVAPYVFSSSIGTFENRFVLRFTNSALGIDDAAFTNSTVSVYKDNSSLMIESSIANLKEVQLFDVRGRLITSKNAINQMSTKFTNLPMTNQVLLVKITSDTGVVLTKKVVY